MMPAEIDDEFLTSLNTLKNQLSFILPKLPIPKFITDDDKHKIIIPIDQKRNSGNYGFALQGTLDGHPVIFKFLKESLMGCDTKQYLQLLAKEAAYQYIFNAISLIIDPSKLSFVPAVLGFTELEDDEIAGSGNRNNKVAIIMQKAVGVNVDHNSGDTLSALSLGTRLDLFRKLASLIAVVSKFNLSHNDTSEANVMFDPVHLRVSLIDYGLSCFGANPDTSLFKNFFHDEISKGSLTPELESLRSVNDVLMKKNFHEISSPEFDRLSQLCGFRMIVEIFYRGSEEGRRLIVTKCEIKVEDDLSTVLSLDGVNLVNETERTTQFFNYSHDIPFNKDEFKRKSDSYSQMIVNWSMESHRCIFEYISENLQSSQQSPEEYAQWNIISAHFEIFTYVRNSCSNHLDYALEDCLRPLSVVYFALTIEDRMKIYFYMSMIYTFLGNRFATALCKQEFYRFATALCKQEFYRLSL
jgi:serine/threonine protein kinase